LKSEIEKQDERRPTSVYPRHSSLPTGTEAPSGARAKGPRPLGLVEDIHISAVDENVVDENVVDKNVFDENVVDEDVFDEDVVDETLETALKGF
jgi:hypothetical protein